MHLFSPDGTRLAILDAHGLTQLTFPSKVKSDRKVAAAPNSLLSQDEAGESLLVYDGIESRTTLYDGALTPTRRWKPSEVQDSLLLPGGQHVLLWDNEKDDARGWVRVLAIHKLDGKTVWQGRPESLPGITLPSLVLGPAGAGDMPGR